LEIGSMRPVATTERARSPRSTVASFDGSISALARVMRVRPKPPMPATTNSAADTYIHFRDLFLAINDLIMQRISDECSTASYGSANRRVPDFSPADDAQRGAFGGE